MKSVTVHEAKTHLSRLLVEVEKGEVVVVRRGDRPIARLVPFQADRPRRPAVGTITSAPVQATLDCFAPLAGDELAEWGLA